MILTSGGRIASRWHSQRMTKYLLGCGIVGSTMFVFVFLLDGATRIGYDPLYHPVSALSLGDRGWLQIANFITICGPRGWEDNIPNKSH